MKLASIEFFKTLNTEGGGGKKRCSPTQKVIKDMYIVAKINHT